MKTLRSILMGAAVGAVVLVFEIVCATVASGFPIVPDWRWILPYVGLAISTRVVVEVIGRRISWLRHTTDRASWTALALVAVALALRAKQLPELTLEAQSIRVAVGGGVLVSYLAFARLLQVIARPPALGPALAAAAGIIALVSLMEFFHSSLSHGALALLSGIAAASVLAAVATRAGPAVRRSLAGAAVAATLLALVATRAPSPEAGLAQDTAPNLIVLLVDTLRDDVFQDVLSTTPEGERFSRALGDAFWFRNVIATAPWTPPSMGSIFTGRYPQEHGFERRYIPGTKYDWTPLTPLRDTVPTLAEGLANHGYWTEAIVNNPHLTVASGMARGFARFHHLDCGTGRLPLLAVLRGRWDDGCLAYEDARRVGSVASERLDQLSSAKQPFFLWIHWMDPHRPLYEHPDLQILRSERALGEDERLYHLETRYVLGEIATWLEAARAAGALERSIVVLLSDHGEMFEGDGHDSGPLDKNGKPKVRGHGHALYEELVRVPLVIRVPGAAAGDRRIEIVTSLVDLYPTIADLVGIKLDAVSSYSQSVAPWLRASGASSPRPHVLSTSTVGGPEMHAVRGPLAKLIVYPHGERPAEYYDLASDPREQLNRIDQNPSNADRLRRGLATLIVDGDEPDGGRAIPVSPDERARLEALGYAE